MINFDTNLLLGYFQSKTGGSAGGSGESARALANLAKAPTPPWSARSAAPSTDALLERALLGRSFIDLTAARLDVRGASEDYQGLFAMHQGLAQLEALARRADAKGVNNIELAKLQKTFARGLEEVGAFVDKTRFDELRMTRGEATDRARMGVGVRKDITSYVTAPIFAGLASEPVPAFQGDVKFTLSVKKLSTNISIDIDLSEMGSTPRTMAAVTNFINGKLAAEGLRTRFSTQRQVGEPKEVQVGGKTITLPAGQDKWAFKISGESTEILTFSAPARAASVYMTQTVGDPDPDGKSLTDDGVTGEQLLKFSTDLNADPTAPPDATAKPGEPNWVDGRAFARDLPEEISKARATVTGPDGSVYMVADIGGEVGGQTLKGEGDAALVKYDSAGNVVWTRTLGVEGKAEGLALSIGPDGKLAMAGSVMGVLDNGDDGASATVKDSFVTVFDANGDELWSHRKGATGEDEATSVGFAADGSVYVVGRSKSPMPGGAALGGWDGYLRSYSPTGTLRSTTAFGTSSDDKAGGMVVDGSAVVISSIEGGQAILRRFDVSGPTPTLTATRNLGGLNGGSLAGLTMDGGRLIIAGSTTNGALSAGTVTRAASGGADAFAASLSADLGGAGDVISYFGGAGDDRASAVTAAGGKVWIAGAATTGLPGGLDPVGEKDGFLAQLDLSTGSVEWSRRFTSKDGFAQPTSIAVDLTGSSVLDRLGLPKGTIDYSDSQKLVAATSVREGDQFQVRARPGSRPVAITIDADETLTSLAQKVRRALGFAVKAEVVADGEARRLQIKPLNDRSTVEILAGAAGRNALPALGLAEGVVRATKVIDGQIAAADGGSKIYGLALDRSLTLDSKEGIKKAIDELVFAQSQIRSAYRYLVDGDTPPSEKKKAITGKPPAYLTNQIANYQAALQRLSGG